MKSTIKPGIAAVVFKNAQRRKILLHYRPDFSVWSLPGGVPHFGESIVDAVTREVYEETFVTVKPHKLIGVFSNPEKWTFNYPDGNTVHGFTVAFACFPVKKDSFIRSGESSKIKWFEPQEALDLMLTAHVEVLNEAIKEGCDAHFS